MEKVNHTMDRIKADRKPYRPESTSLFGPGVEAVEDHEVNTDKPSDDAAYAEKSELRRSIRKNIAERWTKE
jgi:hypothetical protein